MMYAGNNWVSSVLSLPLFHNQAHLIEICIGASKFKYWTPSFVAQVIFP
jgi:hypothetical protein